MQKAEKWESMFGPNHYYNGWDVFFVSTQQQTSAPMKKSITNQNHVITALKKHSFILKHASATLQKVFLNKTRLVQV